MLSPRSHGEESLPPSPTGISAKLASRCSASLDGMAAAASHSLRTRTDDLTQLTRPSVSDLAALRMRTARRHRQAPRRRHAVVHDGLRRDTLITCLQTLLLRPGARARAALEASPSCRRPRTIPSIDAEPARSSTSCAAEGRETWFHATTAPSTRRRSSSSCSPRSGAGPTTPRSSQRLREPALPRSPGSTSTATATATASSSTSGARRAGSRTSPGRTRATRSASTTAGSRRRRSPRRGAGLRLRREAPDGRARARRLADATLADAPRARGGELRRRFDEAFWVEERGGFYALALDGDKRRVDSLCSNIGHLLWSGIVPPNGSTRSPTS